MKLKNFTIDEMRNSEDKSLSRELYLKWLEKQREIDRKLVDMEANKIRRFLNKDKIAKQRKAYREANKDKKRR